MKAKLVAVFAVLLFAGTAHADTVFAGDNSELTIPDGSTVTAISVFQDAYPQYGDMAQVNYSFSDGTGETVGNEWFGYTGTIDFSSPVSDVSFAWFGAEFFVASDNSGNSLPACGNQPQCYGTAVFASSGITQITWQAANQVGGIESMSYTIDADPPSVPEPSSLLLAGMGLAALVGLVRRGLLTHN